MGAQWLWCLSKMGVTEELSFVSLGKPLGRQMLLSLSTSRISGYFRIPKILLMPLGHSGSPSVERTWHTHPKLVSEGFQRKGNFPEW